MKCWIIVFLGHDIPDIWHSVNFRELIVKRARHCASSPLVFDYNQKDNCEAFANLMNGVADTEEGKLGVQNPPCIISCFCCCLNSGLRCCRQKRPLTKEVGARLEDARKNGLLNWLISDQWSLPQRFFFSIQINNSRQKDTVPILPNLRSIQICHSGQI